MLQTAKEEEAKFTSYEELKDFVEDDSHSTKVHRLNLTMGDQLSMHDDHKLVFKPVNAMASEVYDFTPSALKKLFTIMGCGPLFNSMSLESSFGMATAYINNILSPKNPYYRKLNGYNFIEKKGTINGFFSHKYTYVKNSDVLRSANELMKIDNGDGTFNFEEASVVNTRMKLRVTQEYTGFKLKDNKDDICKLGLELRNSHLGDTALSTMIFVKRLICGNGAIANSSKMHNRVIHKGDAGNRIGEILSDAEQGYIDVKNRIETLLSIPYNITSEYDHKSTARVMLQHNAPVKVLPEMSEGRWYNPNKKFKSDYDKTQQLTSCVNHLDNIPHKYPGICSNIFNSYYKDNSERSLYDWTEIFTERANHESYSITEKEEIQENVGFLVANLAKNKVLFTGTS
tara:strand:- start:4398 stop:5597 length:1200 start_codon:yes stop_codon:yes gene_type:complete